MPNLVSVIGPDEDKCSRELYEFSVELGKNLAEAGFGVVCGGHGGIMKGVCSGVKKALNYQWGMTIGILPETGKQNANAYVDIIIPTGLSHARNQMVILTGEAVIALGGGAGTLSELAFAWQYGKKILALTKFDGWSKNLADQMIDERRAEKVTGVNSISEILERLRAF